MTTIVVSAGGTGGHLFPAQALARELLARGRKIVVMTDARGRNYQLAFPGATIEQVSSATFAGSVFTRVVAPLRILCGFFSSLRKLVRIRPAAVVGFGGYPSLPVMIAAQLRGLPTAVHEQNAVLGRANRQLAPRATAVAASFPLAHPVANRRVAYTGNPVRSDTVQLAKVRYEPPRAGEAIRLLVFGGSQGARALSELVPAAIGLLDKELRSRIEVVQQCRAEDIDGVRNIYAGLDVAAEVSGFFNDLSARMAAAHLVISRSGASTISELTVIGRPSILIPFPFATDDHQTANAAVLANAGAAWLVQQRDLTGQKLAQLLESILADPDELGRRAAAAHALGKPDATERLADLVDSIAEAA